MKKNISALSFSEKERICDSVFDCNGPYWHLYTDGTRMQNIFCCEEDFATGMWVLAASLHLSKEARSLTFELMANPEYTPDSYPWGGSCAYFCLWLKHLITSPFERLQILTQRALLHTRDISPYGDLRVISLMPFIPSFCDISLGESMFRDARSYFNSLTRNAEAFSQIASRLKDAIFLTDDELYSVICSHLNKEYSVKSPSQLNAQQKIDTARQMHFSYNATNQQLRRMLRMDLSILEELFP